ncbi:MAG: sulfotransferase [bacterium]|nr:sulfotransferase [bacterium]
MALIHAAWFDDHPPVILLGAARSGTKLLRDSLAEHADLSPIPFDLNFIWRYRNESVRHDEFSLAMARPEVVAYIRTYFYQRTHKIPAPRFVEKTVSNTLRAGFVNAVFPEARFIHLVRDGRAATASASRCWIEHPEVRDAAYLIQKLRWFPVLDNPRYLVRYAWNKANVLLHPRPDAARTWGPVFEGMREMARESSLLEVCAEQWRRCAESAQDEMETSVDPERWRLVRYEDFIQNPADELARLWGFLGLPMDENALRRVSARVHPESLEKWKAQLGEDGLKQIEPILENALRRFGYQ